MPEACSPKPVAECYNQRMDQFEFGGPVAWRPTSSYVEHSRLGAFIRKHGLSGLDELMTRSTTELEWFWRAVLDDLGIEFYEPYSRVIDLLRALPSPGGVSTVA